MVLPNEQCHGTNTFEGAGWLIKGFAEDTWPVTRHFPAALFNG